MRVNFRRFALSAAAVTVAVLARGCWTPGTQPPRVVRSSPPDGASNVPQGTPLSITFNIPAVPASLRVSVSPNIDYTTGWSSGNTTVTLTPADDLTNNTRYTVAVAAVSFDDGSALEAAYSFGFTVIGQVVTVSDKWELWSSGKVRLRGADLHPCSVTNVQTNTCVQATSKQDVQDLRNYGANLINASYPGLYAEQRPYNVNTTAQAYMDNLINWAEQVGIYVVIHVRTGPGRNEAAITDPEGQALTAVWTDQAAHDAWVAMWRYMAERYRNSHVVAGYNLMVEPHVNTWVDPGGTLTPQQFTQQHQGSLADWNAFAAEITAAIRQVDPNTPIIVNSLMWASASWFSALVPTGDARTVYSPHTYDPDVYTTQEGTPAIRYPSVLRDNGTNVSFNRDWLVENFRPVREFAQQYNVSIYVGEFGLFRWIPDAVSFIADEIGLFEQYGWNYAYYVWRGDEPGFDGYNIEYGTDRNNSTPVPSNPLANTFTAYWSQNVNFPTAR